MKNFGNKNGFTLIVIIVVLITVVLVAAFALSRIFFVNIAKGKGAQVRVMLDRAKVGMEAYYALHGGQTPVSGDIATAGLESTAVISGSTFSLTLPTAASAQSSSAGTIVAAAGTYAAGNLAYSLMASDGTNSVTLSRNTAGSWTCSAPTAAPYAGLC